MSQIAHPPPTTPGDRSRNPWETAVTQLEETLRLVFNIDALEHKNKNSHDLYSKILEILNGKLSTYIKQLPDREESHFVNEAANFEKCLNKFIDVATSINNINTNPSELVQPSDTKPSSSIAEFLQIQGHVDLIDSMDIVQSLPPSLQVQFSPQVVTISRNYSLPSPQTTITYRWYDSKSLINTFMAMIAYIVQKLAHDPNASWSRFGGNKLEKLREKLGEKLGKEAGGLIHRFVEENTIIFTSDGELGWLVEG